MEEYKIYLLECKSTGKCYVGVTSMLPEKRWANGEGYRNQPVIYSDIYKYGWSDFKHDVIDIATSYKESREKEEHYISLLNTVYPNGYNIIAGETGEPNALRKVAIMKVDSNGHVIQKFVNTKQLRALYTSNQIRTIRECLFRVQDDMIPRFYDDGYWVLEDIFNDSVKNIIITERARKGGNHFGAPKKSSPV